MNSRPLAMLKVDRWWRQWRWAAIAIVLYSIWRGWLLLLAQMARHLVPETTGFLARESFGRYLPYLVQIWANMDGAIFTLLAVQGYGREQVPFFPLYPLTIRWVSWLSGTPVVISGLLISIFAWAAAVWFIRKLLRADGLISHFWLFFMIMLSFPTAYYYSAVYNDALFLLLAVGCLWWGRQKHWLLAALCGGLAALTRLTGLSLFFYLGTEYLLSLQPTLLKKWSIPIILRTFVRALVPARWWRDRVWLIALVPLFFIGYLGFIQYKFGDWQLFFKGVEVWHRSHLTFPLQTFWRYIKILIIYPSGHLPYWVAWGEALATLLYGVALVWSWQKIRLSYWVFMVVALLIPVCTGTLQGMPRYGLHLYPMFLIFTLWLRGAPLWRRALWISLGLLLMFLYLAAFTRGYFVA